MQFKQSVILLFVFILSCAVAEDHSEYNYEILKTMLRSQTLCPNVYSEYVRRYTHIYDTEIRKCRENASAAKLRLKEASVRDRKKFALKADNSCKAISKCNSGNGNVGNIFGCFAYEGSKTSISMKNIYYEASTLQHNYGKKIQNIENIKSSCTNTTTYRLSVRTRAAINELNKCFRTNKWELVDLFVADIPEASPDPEADENPELAIISNMSLVSALKKLKDPSKCPQ